MHSRMQVIPGAPPLDLDIFSFSGTCLSDMCFFVCFAYIESYEISLFF
jgi:hypothetical protein